MHEPSGYLKSVGNVYTHEHITHTYTHTHTYIHKLALLQRYILERGQWENTRSSAHTGTHREQQIHNTKKQVQTLSPFTFKILIFLFFQTVLWPHDRVKRSWGYLPTCRVSKVSLKSLLQKNKRGFCPVHIVLHLSSLDNVKCPPPKKKKKSLILTEEKSEHWGLCWGQHNENASITYLKYMTKFLFAKSLLKWLSQLT